VALPLNGLLLLQVTVLNGLKRSSSGSEAAAAFSHTFTNQSMTSLSKQQLCNICMEEPEAPVYMMFITKDKQGHNHYTAVLTHLDEESRNITISSELLTTVISNNVERKINQATHLQPPQKWR